jgi:hypothetical protein
MQYALKVLGVIVCLIGAFIMVSGESIFGADYAGIATIVGIIGLGIIARTRRIMP